MVRYCSTSPVLGATVAALLSTTSAQFNPECGLGETPLYIQMHGTDKLTECTDYFDDVDPYAVVTVGQDRLGVSKVTKTIDNEATPTWDQVLSYGCVEENTIISFRVRDQDYIGDEACLGPFSLPAGPWPKSGKPQVICTSSTPGAIAAGTPGTGCISFTLYYGAAMPPTIVTLDGTTTITTAAANTTAPARPPTTPSLPSTLPSKPDTPSSPTPSVVKRPANATTTPTGESSDPSIPPTPRAPSRPPSPITPYTPSSNGTSTRPSLPQGPRNASQPASPAAPAQPPVIQAPSSIAARTEEEKEKEHERQSANTKKKKSAALAGGIVALLAFAGIGVGVLLSRRRRMREEQHGQQLELDEEGGMRRGTAGDTTPGSVAVL